MDAMNCLGFLRRTLPLSCAATLATTTLTVLLATSNPASAASECTILGTRGADVLRGTPGPDIICARGGADVLEGRGGNDRLFGHGGDDRLIGGPGNDLASGEAGDDTILGGRGHDSVIGGGGNDTVVGGDGNDRLQDNEGTDITRGDSGDDAVSAGPGRDRMSGGGGQDTVSYAAAARGVRVDLDGVADDGVGGERDLVASDFENIEGSSDDDVLTGDSGGNLIMGHGGLDRLVGNAGNDRLQGGNHADELFGGAGADALRGDSHNDLLEGAAGTDTLVGGATEPRGGNVCDNDAADLSVKTCTRDSGAPDILNVSAWGPDMLTQGQSVHLGMTTDDVGGIAEAGVRVTRMGEPVAWCDGRLPTVRGVVLSSWQTTCRIPQSAALGGYVVTPWARDRFGHGTNIAADTVPLEDASFAVVSGLADTTAPEVTAVRLSATALTPGQTFDIAADISDPSGVSGAGHSIEFGGAFHDWCEEPGLTRRVGTSIVDGTWTSQCTVPQQAQPGAYQLKVWGTDPQSHGGSPWGRTMTLQVDAPTPG
jgi:hypothetical protein